MLFYHSNAKPMGDRPVIARGVLAKPYPDPTQFDKKQQILRRQDQRPGQPDAGSSSTSSHVEALTDVRLAGRA